MKRRYIAYNLDNFDNLKNIQTKTNKYSSCWDLLTPLWFYVNITLNSPTNEKEQERKVLVERKLEEYNNSSLISWGMAEKIDIKNEQIIDDKFNKLISDLIVTKNQIINFLKSMTYKFIIDAQQVASEQDSYAESYSPNEKRKSYYLEIHGDMGNRIISMFVSNIPELQIQLHHFIMADLANLIKKTDILSGSSLFMHSFASNLFGNEAWYTTPVGNMGGILEYKLKKSSHSKIKEQNTEKYNRLSKYIHTNNLWTRPPVEPTYEYKITNYMKNLWKTKVGIKHTNEDDKEQLGRICEPIDKTITENIQLFVFDYSDSDNLIGGKKTIRDETDYEEKYKKYKLKYLELRNIKY